MGESRQRCRQQEAQLVREAMSEAIVRGVELPMRGDAELSLVVGGAACMPAWATELSLWWMVDGGWLAAWRGHLHSPETRQAEAPCAKRHDIRTYDAWIAIQVRGACRDARKRGDEEQEEEDVVQRTRQEREDRRLILGDRRGSAG